MRKKKEHFRLLYDVSHRDQLNNMRQIESLSARREDTSRFIEAFQKHRTPQIQVLASRHIRRGGSMVLLIPKHKKAASMVHGSSG